MVTAMLAMDKFAQGYEVSALFDIEDFKNKMVDNFGEEFRYQSIYYRDLAVEISVHIKEITEKFNQVFGQNIFS
ncbi:hypothetical protein VAEKB19_6090004 [Vibrio aestuarianus]|nr:hypothetical protein VAEKB19_6090004 [Vibrio aestuarianus]